MEDITCRICGETKAKEEFHHVMYFTKYKKHKVFWCKDCQRMYIELKKGKETFDCLKNVKGNFAVSFE